MKTSDITIVMAYHNRKEQTYNTLSSIKGDGETLPHLIIVDDHSTNNAILNQQELEEKFGSLFESIKLISLKFKDKDYLNPCTPYNIGFSFVKTPITIIQNPECYHYQNVVDHAAKALTDDIYITYGCYSHPDRIFDINKEFIINNCGASQNGEGNWYNHSQYNPRALHFCSAIMTKHLVEIGGFDQRYKFGSCFDDNELLNRIMKKSLKVVIMNTPFVLHQNHYIEKDQNEEIRMSKFVEMNKKLYIEKTLKETSPIANFGTWSVDKYLKELKK